MSRIEIREERCKGCLLCTQVCPQTILVQLSRFNAQGYKVVKMSMLASGNVAMKDVLGPVGMIGFVHQSATQGLISFFYLVALISLNLAIFNLLPLPALDGGRIIFVIIRMITGKAITDKQEAMVHGAGMVLLLSLMVFVTWNDIIKLFK